MKATVIDIKGNKVKDIELDDEVFALKPNKSSIYEAIKNELANKRQGTSSVKTKAEVAGSGTKPWKQKGTGNARAGQRNSPLWRKGGIVFGPQPRDYYQKMPKQKRKLALSMAFANLAQENNLVLVDLIKFEEAKTKNVATFLKNLKVDGKKVIIALSKKDDVVKTAAKNIKDVVVEQIANLNAYQVMWADKIVTTPEAIDSIKEKQA